MYCRFFVYKNIIKEYGIILDISFIKEFEFNNT